MIRIFITFSVFSIYRYKTRAGNDERYKYQLIVGYVVPLIFVILTGIVEGTAPRCSLYKPRFAEEGCFFAGKFSTVYYDYTAQVLLYFGGNFMQKLICILVYTI